MLERALRYIVDELVIAMDLTEGEVNLDSLNSLKEKKNKGITISLLKVEEEKSLKNNQNYYLVKERDKENKEAFFQLPKLYLDLDVVFVFDFEQYVTSLKYLSLAANYFHKNNSFPKAKDIELDTNEFPAGLSNFSLDFKNLSIEQLNQIWSMCGGIHYPALFYRMRLIELEQDKAVKGPNIQEVKLELKKKLKAEIQDNIDN